MKLLLILALLLSTLYAKGYEAPNNFSQAKKVMRKIYLNYKKSYLKDCTYIYDLKSCTHGTIVDASTCDGEDENLSIIWKKIVPPSHYGADFTCMKNNICTNMQGKLYKGERCCRKSSKAYLEMEADLFNVVPVLSNNQFIKAKKGDLREGDIARVYLYFYKQYGMHLNDYEIENLIQAHKNDPVSKQECEIYQIVYSIQGRENPWMTSACETLLKSKE